MNFAREYELLVLVSHDRSWELGDKLDAVATGTGLPRERVEGLLCELVAKAYMEHRSLFAKTAAPPQVTIADGVLRVVGTRLESNPLVIKEQYEDGEHEHGVGLCWNLSGEHGECMMPPLFAALSWAQEQILSSFGAADRDEADDVFYYLSPRHQFTETKISRLYRDSLPPGAVGLALANAEDLPATERFRVRTSTLELLSGEYFLNQYRLILTFELSGTPYVLEMVDSVGHEIFHREGYLCTQAPSDFAERLVRTLSDLVERFELAGGHIRFDAAHGLDRYNPVLNAFFRELIGEAPADSVEAWLACDRWKEGLGGQLFFSEKAGCALELRDVYAEQLGKYRPVARFLVYGNDGEIRDIKEQEIYMPVSPEVLRGKVSDPAALAHQRSRLARMLCERVETANAPETWMPHDVFSGWDIDAILYAVVFGPPPPSWSPDAAFLKRVAAGIEARGVESELRDGLEALDDGQQALFEISAGEFTLILCGKAYEADRIEGKSIWLRKGDDLLLVFTEGNDFDEPRDAVYCSEDQLRRFLTLMVELVHGGHLQATTSRRVESWDGDEWDNDEGGDGLEASDIDLATWFDIDDLIPRPMRLEPRLYPLVDTLPPWAPAEPWLPDGDDAGYRAHNKIFGELLAHLGL